VFLFKKQTMVYYVITLTKAGGFTSGELEPFIEAFNKQPHAFVINEYGQSGLNSHIQGIVEYDTIKTNNVTVRIKKLYDVISCEITPNSIRVKKATDFIGALIYSQKELKDPESSAKLLCIKGWQSSWIDQQIKDNVAKIPFKMLKKRLVRVTQGTGGALMYEWCIANNRVVKDKYSFGEVVKDMASSGYAFGSVRGKGLYADVMSAFGDGSAARDVMLSDLHFL